MKNNTEIYPLTQPQKRIWLTQMLHPDSVMFHIGGYVLVKGALDPVRLRKSIAKVIKRNIIFHTRIMEQDGEYYQYYQPEAGNVTFEDLSRSCLDEGGLEQWAQRRAAVPFVLKDSFLYQFIVFQLNSRACGYFVKLHHVIADGWSFQLLTNMISDQYEGQDVAPADSYLVDFLKEEANYLQSARYAKERLFWKEKLDKPGLSGDRAASELAGKRKIVHISRDIKEQLEQYGKECGVSLNAVLLTAYLIYLGKSTHENDITIGIPFAGRNTKEEWESLGMYVSSVPFRFQIDADETVSQMAVRVLKELTTSFLHHRFPYNMIVKELGLAGTAAESLYDNCFNYYNLKLRNKIAGLEAAGREFYNGEQHYSRQVIIKGWDENSGLQMEIDYKVSVYPDSEARQMAKQLLGLISSLKENKDRKVKHISLLSQTEYRQLIYQFNDTDKAYPVNKSVVELFDEQASMKPDRIALEDGDDFLTYGELHHKTNHLVTILKAKGVKKGSRVGIITRHSFETIIAMLGILKLGGVYIPIDDQYPKARIDYIIEDAAVELILTNSAYGKDEVNGREVVCLEHEKLSPGIDHETITCETDPESPAYILYTSGTTGKPKGIIVTHMSLANYVIWADEMYIHGEDVAFPLFTSLSFDLTVTAVFTPLISGNKIVIYRDDKEEYVLYRIIKDNKVQAVKLTPSHMSLLTDQAYRESSVKRLIVGGEQLTCALAEKITANFGGNMEIFNEYGPSEATVGCMIYQYSQERDKGFAVPIGKPAANTKIYVLGADRSPVPIKETGEIFISGKGLAAGYLNQKELTDERFMENPFEEGQKMYATGDLARFISDVCIEYIGRKDQQIKINGRRIELEEIEHVIKGIPTIKDAVILYKDGKDGFTGLCCYYVKDGSVTPAKLQKEAAVKLPQYMIPAWFVEIPAVPLTANGKTDKDALLSIKIGQGKTKPGSENYDAADKALLTGIKEVLKTENLSLADNFYELGGDSIHAIRIASRLSEAGFRIRAVDILEHPKLYDMVKQMERAYRQDNIEADGEAELTPVISRFFRMNHRNPHYYNQSLAVRLDCRINKGQIDEAFTCLVRFHDSLRMNYKKEKHKLFYEEKYRKSGFQSAYVDLSQVDEKLIEEAAINISEKIKAGFDIEKDLLIRTCLFKLSATEQILLITAHHIIIDGISWGILLDDLEKLLKLSLTSQAMDLSGKSASYQSFSKYWLENSAGDSRFKAEYLEKVNMARSGFIRTPHYATYRNSIKKQVLVSAELTARLFGMAGRNIGTSELGALVAAAVMALYRIDKDLCRIIDLEWHGRNAAAGERDLSRTIGWFTIITPAVIEEHENGATSIVKAVERAINKSRQASDECSFVTWYADRRAGQEAIMKLNYLGNYTAMLNRELFQYADFPAGEDISPDNYMMNALEVNAVIIDSVLRISLLADREVFDDAMTEQIGNDLPRFLEELIRMSEESDDTGILAGHFDTVDLSEEDMKIIFS